jgi:hypothetical protein
MYMPNDPQARIRLAFVRSKGVPILLNLLGKKHQNVNALASRTSQVILCLFAWMDEDKTLVVRAELAQSCFNCDFARKVIENTQQTMHSEQCIATSVILLSKMADEPEFLPQIARAVATVDRINTLLEIMREFAAEDDIVFTIMRLICSLLMDRNQRRRFAMHSAVSRTKVADTVIAVAPIHENSVRTQTQASTLIELLTEKADFGHKVNVSGAMQFIVAAMARHPTELTLQRSGIRVTTNFLREQAEDSVLVFRDETRSEILAVVNQARRQYRSDAIIRARCHYFHLLLAMRNRNRLGVVLQSLKTPFLSVPCVRQHDLKIRLI